MRRTFLKCPACGGKFIALREPVHEFVPGEQLQPQWFEHLDGSQPVAGDRQDCDSCGKNVRYGFHEIIKEESVG